MGSISILGIDPVPALHCIPQKLGLSLMLSGVSPLPTFYRILKALRMWRNLTPRFASKPERYENIKKYIFSRGNRTHNLSRLQSHTCFPAPELANRGKREYFNDFRFTALDKQFSKLSSIKNRKWITKYIKTTPFLSCSNFFIYLLFHIHVN